MQLYTQNKYYITVNFFDNFYILIYTKNYNYEDNNF